MNFNRILEIFNKLIHSFTQKTGIWGAVVLIGLMLLTVGDVFLRYFFSAPILGSFELTELTMVALVFSAIPWAAEKKANIKVDLFIYKFSPRIRAVFDSIFCFISLCFIGFCAWYTLPQIIYIWQFGSFSHMLKIPIFPFYILIAFGFFLLFFILLVNLIEFIKMVVKK